MEITRKSILTGKEHTIDINITEKQITDWENGMSIQNAMPCVSASDREFIISGITHKEWNDTFGSNEE